MLAIIKEVHSKHATVDNSYKINTFELHLQLHQANTFTESQSLPAKTLLFWSNCPLLHHPQLQQAAVLAEKNGKEPTTH